MTFEYSNHFMDFDSAKGLNSFHFTDASKLKCDFDQRVLFGTWNAYDFEVELQIAIAISS